jgi:hypothetical protein
VRQGLRFLRAAEHPGDAQRCLVILHVAGLAEDWRRLDARIESLCDEIEALARQNQACVRMM